MLDAQTRYGIRSSCVLADGPGTKERARGQGAIGYTGKQKSYMLSLALPVDSHNPPPSLIRRVSVKNTTPFSPTKSNGYSLELPDSSSSIGLSPWMGANNISGESA
ncbi:unnamed protein product [Arctogadus glacialis]